MAKVVRTREIVGPTIAEQVDRYRLYQASVQDPDHEVTFFDRVYKEALGRLPRVLREDFCGTFAVSCRWAEKRGRLAVAVDLDPEPLEWGRAHNLSALGESQQQRVSVREADVRDVDREGPPADVLAAQNFSFWLFKTREGLRDYFEVARENLADEGVMVLDMMGGAECFEEEHEDLRRIGRDVSHPAFTYVWEQNRFNPINHDAVFHIHFRFRDGSELREAFTYEWRFWTIPEVRELLHEVGFVETHVYWEGADPTTGEGDGNWTRQESASPDPAWLAYIVAVKRS